MREEKGGEMTDLEMTRLCAEAMGMEIERESVDGLYARDDPRLKWCIFDPLHDDAQAMALEDWLIERGELIYGRNTMIFNSYDGIFSAQYPVMNKQLRRRAIVECVSKMQASK